ncbi:MAG: hypothetical protein WHV67_05015, partial [Thermoanaerobaculia bacterium]
ISEIQNPKKTGLFCFFQQTEFYTTLLNIMIYNNLIFISFYQEEPFVLEAKNFGGIFLKNLSKYPETIIDFKIKENLAFILTNREFLIMDISRKENFKILDSYQVVNAEKLNVKGNYCYIKKNDEVLVFDILNPKDINYLSSFYFPDLLDMYFGEEIGIFTHKNYRVTLFDFQNPLLPSILSQINTNEKIYSVTFYKNMVLLSGDKAIYLYDISDPSSPYFLSSWESDIWGDKYGIGMISVVDFKDNILIFPDWYKMHFIDISNPLSPFLLFDYEMEDNYFWRVDIFKNYIITDSPNGLLIFDISNLENINKIEITGYWLSKYELKQNTKGVEILNFRGDFLSIMVNFEALINKFSQIF